MHTKEEALAYSRTKEGLIKHLYNAMVRRTRDRGHEPINFSKASMIQWLMNDWVFGLLFKNWVNCGYLKPYRPSIDRIKDSLGYTYQNIQLIPWGENDAKGRYQSNKPISQFTREGKFVKHFMSTKTAQQMTGIDNGSICNCLKGKLNTAGGYTWKYKETYD